MAYLSLKSPVTVDQLDAIHADLTHVQFASALSDDEYVAVAERLKPHPNIVLRAFGSWDGSITNLDFLRFFPILRGFQADALYNSLSSFEGLNYLSDDLRFIGLGQTKKRLSLAPLARFKDLRRLHLEGQTKDIDVVATLQSLRAVTLRSVTLPDLPLLVELPELRALELKLGGTKNLGLLPRMRKLDYLELWMVRGLNDLSPFAELPGLEFLFLQSLRQVTELPDLSRVSSLRRLWLETMKGLTNLAPIRTAPALRQLVAFDLPQLQPEAFSVLTDHPSLASFRGALGSKHKDDALARIIQLPRSGDWQKPLDDWML